MPNHANALLQHTQPTPCQNKKSSKKSQETKLRGPHSGSRQCESHRNPNSCQKTIEKFKEERNNECPEAMMPFRPPLIRENHHHRPSHAFILPCPSFLLALSTMSKSREKASG
jgi:hypothetical protein